jgi:hypothetical protein
MIPLSHHAKDPKWIIGVLISCIVLAMGAFLYLQTEGDDVSGIDRFSSASGTGSIAEVTVEGDPLTVSQGEGNALFIKAIIPGDATLKDGAYRMKVDSKLDVRVQTINATGGVLYFKSSENESEEKIADLQPSDLSGEYQAAFEVKKDMSGLLIAVMKGNNGQEAQVSVNVAAER